MTVQRKTIAKGTVLSIGPVGGSLAEFGRILTFTPPAEDFETVEAPELNPQDDDGNPLDGDPVELGDEIFGEFTFETYWDPRHTDATQLDTWRAAKTELTFQLDTPHPTDAARMTFNGKIKTLTPSQLTKREYYKRTVTVIRTSGITSADKP
ncbi:MAG TPA: hypothetical protein DDW52_24085 [Planctomycetaceae bacterium]|nr:hypothetical protein [Planctomycetaceae bacterium]